MADYLKRYVGTYRVKADVDLDTNDFPRLENGNLDPSFDDYYIDCKNNIKIRHGVQNVLSCYIPSKSRGMNVLRQIYEDHISKDLPKEKSTYLEKLCQELVDKNILVSADILDAEAYFEFKSNMLDYIAKIVGAKTYGANISPMSAKNFDKTPYKIPEKDMELYKEAIKDFPKRVSSLHGTEQLIVDGFFVRNVNKQFDEVIVKSQPKGFDLTKDQRLKGLRGKEYIHSIGMWQDYCEFLKTFV